MNENTTQRTETECPHIRAGKLERAGTLRLDVPHNTRRDGVDSQIHICAECAGYALKWIWRLEQGEKNHG
jgi:hypothetical protein